eukprot:516363_1
MIVLALVCVTVVASIAYKLSVSRAASVDKDGKHTAVYVAQPPYDEESMEAPTGRPLNLIARTLTGRRIVLLVDSGDSVEAVSAKIHELMFIHPEKHHYLAFEGKPLEDGRTLAYYNITNGSTIFLVIPRQTPILLNKDGEPLSGVLSTGMRISRPIPRSPPWVRLSRPVVP